MSRNIRWDESVQENTLCLLEALLRHADDEFEDEELKTAVYVEWKTGNKLRVTGFEDKQTSGKRKQIVEVGTKKEYLLKLLKKAGKSLKLPKLKNEAGKSIQDRELDEIQTALDCLKQLGVREDEKSVKNQGYWKFILTLKHQTTTQEENLDVVRRSWRVHSRKEIIDLSEETNSELDDRPNDRLKKVNYTPSNHNIFEKDFPLQEVGERNAHLPTNITIYISLESTNSIRSMLQMQNEQAVSGLMPFNSDDLIKIITEFPKLAFRYSEEYLQNHNIASGKKLYNLALVQPIRQVLERLESSVVELVIDPVLQCLPWELMHDGNNFICFKHYIGRRIMPEVSSRKLKKIAKRILLPSAEKLRLLIVSMEDTTCDTEASLIYELACRKNAKITKITQGTRHEVLNQIYSGQDIVHFVGHVASDGFLLSDGILDINILNEAISQHSTSLVVLSACETGLSDKVNNKSTGYQLALNELNVICSLTWVTSNLGQIIASTFYKNVLAGKSFGESLQLAKKMAYPMSGWWGYVLYGNPSKSLISIEEAWENKSMEWIK